MLNQRGQRFAMNRIGAANALFDLALALFSYLTGSRHAISKLVVFP